MTINIRNDRGKYIASIEVINDHIIEETLNGCYVSDLDGNDDGSFRYRLDINPPQKFICVEPSLVVTFCLLASKVIVEYFLLCLGYLALSLVFLNLKKDLTAEIASLPQF